MLDSTTSVVLQRERGYNLFGADISYLPGNWTFRGEYIQQHITSKSGTVAPQSSTWKAWYLQASYRFAGTGWEPIIRFSKYMPPNSDQNQRQWAFGIDYWFMPSLVAQVAFENTRGYQHNNTFLVQVAFGF